MSKEGPKGETPNLVWYKGKDFVEGNSPTGQEAMLNKAYLGKHCHTEHGIGIVVGFDLPKSRAWRLKVKVPGHSLNKSAFPNDVLCFELKEVKLFKAPNRIQRSRKAGDKQPSNTKYCGRGKNSKWGNPFRAVQTEANPDKHVVFVITHGTFARFCQNIKDQTGPFEFGTKQEAQQHAARLFGKLMDAAPGQYPVHELSGYQYLSCWCGLDSPCHVDEIILRIEKNSHEANNSKP